jgi:hypothetical protein
VSSVSHVVHQVSSIVSCRLGSFTDTLFLVHVECAHQAGYILGFDIAPVKGSRRDQTNIVSINGEAGAMTAAVWCKEHHPTKTIVHRMHDIVDDTGLNALQLYVQHFKQADLTLTGTVRKATLVNQSTKVQNPAPSVTAPNRRASTTAVASNGPRGSVSNIKVEEGPGSEDLLSGHKTAAEDVRSCITCDVGVSPKWWPYPSTSAGFSTSSGRSLFGADKSSPFFNGEDRAYDASHSLTNGHAHKHEVEESPKLQMALATAALDDRPVPPDILTGEFQCHKCHFRKVKKPHASPLQRSPPRRELVQAQAAVTAPSVATPPLANAPLVQANAHYSWPAQPPYSPTGHHTSHGRRIPPSPPMVYRAPPSPRYVHTTSASNQLMQFGPRRSPPREINGSSHPLNGQSQMRQMPQSPQMINGYPNSPHGSMNGSHHMQNGAYGSYASTRPPPQHLTNGGPPPRAPENPFAHHSHGPVHHHPPFGGSHASPPMNREPLPMNREPHSQSHVVRTNNGQVNGGASASPSLRNLLS